MRDMIRQAEDYATLQHSGQRRQWGGEPYIEHPKRVAQLVSEFTDGFPGMVAAALLHDVCEDCNVSFDDIHVRFGAIVAVFVEQLTAPNKACLAQTQTIKVADIADNMRDIADVAPPAQALAYIAKKERQLDTLTLANPNLWLHARRALVAARTKIEARAS